MADRVMPTLSSSGFVKNPPELADRLLSYFFLTEASQSELYYENLTSLPDLIQKNNGETFVLEQVTKDTLNRYFSRYFDSVEVQTTTARLQPGDESRTNLTIYVKFVANNITYNLGNTVQIVDGKIKEIVYLNNTGA